MKHGPSIVWIALGANVSGAWGSPADSLRRALAELGGDGIRILRCSAFYRTAPVGSTRQPPYTNAVVAIGSSLPPAALLRALKRLELRAGRRANGRWGPRPLDLDILDFGGRVIGRPAARRAQGRLVLPHPEMHRRGFVLVPLAQIAPHWHHPRLGVTAGNLLRRMPLARRGITELPG